jgi:hypothetical protein
MTTRAAASETSRTPNEDRPSRRRPTRDALKDAPVVVEIQYTIPGSRWISGSVGSRRARFSMSSPTWPVVEPVRTRDDGARSDDRGRDA